MLYIFLVVGDPSTAALREPFVNLLIHERNCVKWYEAPAESYFKKLAVELSGGSGVTLDVLKAKVTEVETAIFTLDISDGAKTPKLFLDAHDVPMIDLLDSSDDEE